MPDPNADFVALPGLLEASAQQPALDVIRSRRRRTRSLVTVAGAMVATLVIAIGGAVTMGGVGRHLAPPGAPRPTDTPDAAGAIIPGIDGLAVTASGLLYALANTCSSYLSCDRTAGRHPLLVSRDLAATWSEVADAPVRGELVAASESQLWINGQSVEIPVGKGWTTAASTDGGHTWQSWVFEEVGGAAGFNRNALHLIDTAGGTTWISQGPHVYAANGVARPALTASQPPDFNNIYQLVAIGANHAVVMGSANNMSPSVWFETTDRGEHWIRIADPCADTPQAGSIYSDLAAAPDGSWWVACVSAPVNNRPIPLSYGASPPPAYSPPSLVGPTFPEEPGPHAWPRQLVVSTDGGRIWQHRGAITDPIVGLGLSLHPQSATIAWRTGHGGDITRTIDGASWTAVAALAGIQTFLIRFLAMNSNTAIYLAAIDTTVDPNTGTYSAEPVFTATRDGGVTWTTHPLPTIK